jgi:hypothetical protein
VPDRERLGGGRISGRAEEVVQGLHRVPRSERSGPEDPLAQRLQHRADARERLIVQPADHERQGARLGSGDPARYRRVDHPDAERGEITSERLRAHRVGRAHVQHHGPGRERGGDAALPAQHRLADSAAIREHGHDHGRAGEGLRPGGRLAAVGGDEPLLCVRVGVPDH